MIANHKATIEKLIADHKVAMASKDAAKVVKRKCEDAPETETRPAKQQAMSSDDEDDEDMCDMCGVSKFPYPDDNVSGFVCPKCGVDGREL